MAKAGELNWDELHKTKQEDSATPSALWVNNPNIGVAPKGQAFPLLKKGEVPVRPSDEEITKAVLANAPKQATDEELFGHLVVTEEQAKRAEDEWNNRSNSLSKAAEAKIGIPLHEETWGSGTSFNSTLSPKELAERNAFTGE